MLIQRAAFTRKFFQSLLIQYVFRRVRNVSGGTNVSYKDLLTICEGLGQAWSLYTRFEQTHLAASLILQFGNDQQKTRYLPQIAAGTIRPALCFPGSEMFVFFFSLGNIIFFDPRGNRQVDRIRFRSIVFSQGTRFVILTVLQCF